MPYANMDPYRLGPMPPQVSVSGSDGAPEAATLQRASTAIDRSLDAMGAVSGEAAALVLEGVSTSHTGVFVFGIK